MRMKKQLSQSAKPYGAKSKKRRGAHIGGRKQGKRRAVNLAIDEEILAAAKAQKINLSETLEDELRKRTQAAREAKWRIENREFIESYNRLIERAGVFGEEFQDWDDPPV
jgi:antitoxin CcdA